MAKNQHFRLEGFDQLDKVLKELADVNAQAARRALRESLTAAARPVVRAAKAKVPKRTGRLRRSLAVATAGNRRGPVTVAIGPRTKGRQGARHGHLVEFGHKLVRGGKLGKGGRVVGFVPPRPFLRPAWDAEGGEKALRRLAAELGPRIVKHAERIARKHGVKQGRRR